MDFIRYAERAAGLLNAGIGDLEALSAFLEDRAWLLEHCTEKDTALLQRFQRELRPVFEAADRDDTDVVVELLNDLMVHHPVTPRISSHTGDLHLHAASRTQSVAELLVGEALLGLATLVCDLGATRLGVCAAAPAPSRAT